MYLIYLFLLYVFIAGDRVHKENKESNMLTNIVQEPKKLKAPTICEYCFAKLFSHETRNFCCSKGEITLVTNNIPLELYNLYTLQTSESLQFRNLIRSYNNSLAFTSMDVKYDKDLYKRNKGIYTFRVQGQVYHYINYWYGI